MNDVGHIADGNAGDETGLPPSVTPEEFDLLKQVVLFSREDEFALQRVWRILAKQSDDYLDRFLGLVAAHPVLDKAFTEPFENPESDSQDIQAARQRFRRWLLATCKQATESTRPEQFYTPAVENETLPFRYVIALILPLTALARSLLASEARDEAELESMSQALAKSLLLQAALLSRKYVKDGLW